MDFPKSVPDVGLINGKFADEDPLAATPGSLIPSAWGNAVTLEILNVIEAAGLDPNELNTAQLLAAIEHFASGAVVYADQSEAEAGEEDAKVMSPLRVFQAIAKVVKQATEGAYGWLKIGTQTQVNTGADDGVALTPKKLAAATQIQAHTAFTTGGTATALTLAPVPAIQAYAPNQRFSVKFSVTGGLNPTLNVSGKGPKSLKQYDATGQKVSAVFVADQVADIINDGVDFVLLNGLAPIGTASTIGVVKLATAAQDLAGVVGDVASTPYGIGQLLPKRTFAANDFIRIPNVAGGLIIQWGTTASVAGGGGSAITSFPTPFPNAVMPINATLRTYNGAGSSTPSWIQAKTLNNFTIVNQNVSPATFDWFAIGY